MDGAHVLGGFVDWLAETARECIQLQRRNGVLNIWIVGAGLIMFGLAWRHPIARRVRTNATSAGWYFITATLTAMLVVGLGGPMNEFFRGPLSFLTTDLGHTWPPIVRIVMWLLLLDCADYWAHRLMHGLPLLWRFHQLHHSADQMNFWVSRRSHPIDAVITRVIIVVPLLMFREALLVVAGVALARAIQGIALHSNHRKHLGKVDAIIVTTQWHRIHHSALPEHYNTNFGTTFTIWDRLFGTGVVPQPGEFPAVGLGPGMCPPDAQRLRDMPGTMVAQFLFPFRRSSRNTLRQAKPATLQRQG